MTRDFPCKGLNSARTEFRHIIGKMDSVFPWAETRHVIGPLAAAKWCRHVLQGRCPLNSVTQLSSSTLSFNSHFHDSYFWVDELPRQDNFIVPSLLLKFTQNHVESSPLRVPASKNNFKAKNTWELVTFSSLEIHC